METTDDNPNQDLLELEQERDTLAGDLEAKVEELKDVALELAKSAILSRAQRAALLVMSAVIAILTIVLITIGIQSRDNTEATKHSVESTQQVVNLIQDCLNPNGKCYKNARNNQNSNTQLINRFTTAAAVCAKTEDTEVLIRECIEKKVNNP